MAFPPWDTAGNILNDAAIELGVATSPNADPMASTDPTFIQLARLMKKMGRRMWRWRNWTYLQQIYTFVTAAGQAQYAKPPDFGRIINQTGWNRTNRLPLGGPLSPQNWEYFKARLIGVVFTVLWRELQNQVWLFPDTNTPGNFLIAYEYVSRWWVQPAVPAWSAKVWPALAVVQKGGNFYITLLGGNDNGAGPSGTGSGVIVSGGVNWLYVPPWAPATGYGTGGQFTVASNGGNIYQTTAVGTSAAGSGPQGNGSGIADNTVVWKWLVPLTNPSAEAPASSSDLIWFDPLLMTDALKLAFRKARGLDFTAEQDDFAQTWCDVTGDDSAAQVLNLFRSQFTEPIIGDKNVPVTGFGQ